MSSDQPPPCPSGQFRPVRVNITERKTGDTKEEQIEEVIRRWYGKKPTAPPLSSSPSSLSSSPPSPSSSPSSSPTRSPVLKEDTNCSPQRPQSPPLVGFSGIRSQSSEGSDIINEKTKTRIGIDPLSERARDISNLRKRGLDWVPDEAVLVCFACSTPFSIVLRKHHCRLCGRIFCDKCCPKSGSTSFPNILNHNSPVRACCLCFKEELLDAHTDSILYLTSLRTGQVVSASADNRIRIWEIHWERNESSGGVCVATLCGHTDHVRCVSELRDNGACDKNGVGSVGLRASGALRSSGALRASGASSPSRSGEDVRIVSVSLDKSLRIWKLIEGQEGRLMEGQSSSYLRTTDPLFCVVSLFDGRIVAGTSSGHLIVCRYSSLCDEIECTDKLLGHKDFVTCLEHSPETLYIISGSGDGEIRFWDMGSNVCLAVLTGHSAPVNSLSLIPGAEGCFVSGSEDASLRIWKVNITESESGVVGEGKFLASLHGHSDPIQCVRISKGQYIVSGSADCSIVLWSLATGKIVSKFVGHEDCVNCLYCLGNGLIISGSADKTIRVWKYMPPARISHEDLP